MNLRELLKQLESIATANGLSKPFVVGGVPRDLYLAHLENDAQLKNDVFEHSDFDITTGNDDAHKLAELFASAIGGKLKKVDNDHFKVVHKGIAFDFSKNLTYENIDEILKSMGKTEITDLDREIYSRDFTANTLLLTTDLSKLIDITGKGKADVKAKILTCPVDCEISMKNDPKRMLRAFYFRAKHGFSFSKQLEEALKTNVELLETIRSRYASEMLNDILHRDPDLLDELIEFGFLQRLPITKMVNKMLVKNRKVLDVLK